MEKYTKYPLGKNIYLHSKLNPFGMKKYFFPNIFLKDFCRLYL